MGFWSIFLLSLPYSLRSLTWQHQLTSPPGAAVLRRTCERQQSMQDQAKPFSCSSHVIIGTSLQLDWTADCWHCCVTAMPAYVPSIMLLAERFCSRAAAAAACSSFRVVTCGLLLGGFLSVPHSDQGRILVPEALRAACRPHLCWALGAGACCSWQLYCTQPATGERKG